jgi:hypothetical protein
MGNDCAIPDMIEVKLFDYYELARMQIESKSVGACILMLQTFVGQATCSILAARERNYALGLSR